MATWLVSRLKSQVFDSEQAAKLFTLQHSNSIDDKKGASAILPSCKWLRAEKETQSAPSQLTNGALSDNDTPLDPLGNMPDSNYDRGHRLRHPQASWWQSSACT